MSNEIKIFISYSREDSSQVLPLYHRLKSAGFSPWIDQEDLLPGAKWRTAIEAAIRNADFFIVCLSSRSSNRRGFIQRELKVAFDLLDERLEDDIYIIPLRLEDCEIPYRVDELQCVNLYEDGGWERLLKALRIQVERLRCKAPTSSEKLPPALIVSPTSNSPVISPLEPTVSTPQQPASKAPANLAGSLEFEFTTDTLDAVGKIQERNQRRAYQLVEELGGGIHLEMVAIPSGKFWMGSTEREAMDAFYDKKRYGRYAKMKFIDHESPQHQVIVSPFIIGKYAVTQSQWLRVMGSLPKFSSALRLENHPVVNVSWEDVMMFCQELSKLTRQHYRLPTEAEWEYAARAGTTTPFAFGENINPAIVNYFGNSPFGLAAKGTCRETTVPVGILGIANAYGLYDMHGNVDEWCSDWYGKDYYRECLKHGTVIDPQGPSTGMTRVKRGGSYAFGAFHCRSAARSDLDPREPNRLVGFRVVREFK